MGALGLLSLGAHPFSLTSSIGKFPQGDRLGRVNVGMAEVKKIPDADSPTIGKLYEDAVVPWIREVVGKRPYRFNQRWVEIPQGYIWAAYLQPVKNIPNPPRFITRTFPLVC